MRRSKYPILSAGKVGQGIPPWRGNCRRFHSTGVIPLGGNPSWNDAGPLPVPTPILGVLPSIRQNIGWGQGIHSIPGHQFLRVSFHAWFLYSGSRESRKESSPCKNPYTGMFSSLRKYLANPGEHDRGEQE